jgi:hypothetical protein
LSLTRTGDETEHNELTITNPENVTLQRRLDKLYERVLKNYKEFSSGRFIYSPSKYFSAISIILLMFRARTQPDSIARIPIIRDPRNKNEMEVDGTRSEKQFNQKSLEIIEVATKSGRTVWLEPGW